MDFDAHKRIIDRIERLTGPQPPIQRTCADRAKSAWGNLAVERPGLTYERVLDIVCPDGPDAPA